MSRQLAQLTARVRDDALRVTAGDLRYTKRGFRPCLMCKRNFLSREGCYWCQPCYQVIKSDYSHRNDRSHELVRLDSLSDTPIVDDIGRDSTFLQLAHKYRKELMERRVR